MRKLKKALKITGIVLLILLFGFYWVFASFTAPKNDEVILETLSESVTKPIITKENFKNFTYRKVSIQKDTTLPTLVFVHGTIGSCVDFSKYITDSLLQTKANFIAYDRVGYNYKDENDVQESIAFERDLLESLLKDLNPEKTVVVGYSYGGPIALAIRKQVKKVVLCAPAVYSKVEPMPSIVNLYKWKATTWLVPAIWKEASKEKLSHREDLQNFENNWKLTPNNIISIHGDNDWIVPLSNSEYLQEQLLKDKFELITIPDAGHELIWSNFDLIKKQLLKSLD